MILVLTSGSYVIVRGNGDEVSHASFAYVGFKPTLYIKSTGLFIYSLKH